MTISFPLKLREYKGKTFAYFSSEILEIIGAEEGDIIQITGYKIEKNNDEDSVKLNNQSLKKKDGVVIKRFERVRSQNMNPKLKEKVAKVAYFLSRFEHNDLYPHLKQYEVFREVANILGTKPNTLRNLRDTYDPKVNKIKEPRLTKRKGWHQRSELPRDLGKIFDEYRHKNKQEILKEINKILNDPHNKDKK